MFMKLRNAKSGFTLLEIMIVVIIIGILATLALPRFVKTARKAKCAEAYSTIGQVKDAESRYYSENSALTNDLALLDIENPNALPNAKFTYAVGGATPDNMTVTATGNAAGGTAGITVTYTAATGRMVTVGL